MFHKKKLYIFIIISIIFIGAFLRFYKLPQNLIFHGELGVDYLAVRDILGGNRTALLGPRTSHEWLYLAPLFYWILAGVLPLFNYHPVSGAYFFAVVGVVTIYLCYKVISLFLGRKIGLLSSYLLAISPAWVRLTRDSRFNAIAAMLFFPFLYFLVKSIKDPAIKRDKNLFWIGLILGISYSFFPTIIVLLPSVILLIIIKRKSFKLKSLWRGLVGLLIPLIPFLIYNLKNKFEMIFKLVAWIPYRVAGFFGLYPKNTVNLDILKNNFITLYVFFRESWFPKETFLAVILFWAVLGYFAYRISRGIYNKNNFWFVLILICVVSYLGLFLHGNPPKHYYLAIFPVPIIITSYFLVSLSKRKIGLLLSVMIIALITTADLRFYFSQDWFHQPQDMISSENSLVAYKLQEEIVSYIAKDAKGKEFELRRVGPLDHFERDFAQNYIYLLWRLGNEPVDEVSLTYTIYENTKSLPKDEEVFWIGNVAVTKKTDAKY